MFKPRNAAMSKDVPFDERVLLTRGMGRGWYISNALTKDLEDGAACLLLAPWSSADRSSLATSSCEALLEASFALLPEEDTSVISSSTSFLSHGALPVCLGLAPATSSSKVCHFDAFLLRQRTSTFPQCKTVNTPIDTNTQM